jgi:hypothetical protein
VRLAKSAVKCKAFYDTLRALHGVTGHPAFNAAANAMVDVGFVDGDIKHKLMSTAQIHKCFDAAWIAMPDVHMWVHAGSPVKHAAKMVAIELGIEGTSLASVTEEIWRLYPKWKAEIKPSD